MADETPNPQAGDGTNPNPNPNGAAPANPEGGEGGESTFDPSKLADGDFAKLFDDPRLYQHSRFKELNDKAKTASDLQKQIKDREEKELKEKGEWEKIAKQKEKEFLDLQTSVQTQKVDNAIMAEASKKNIKDLDAALKLIDKTNIKLDENGQVVGLTEALDSLVKERPYLLEVNRSTLGNPTNPSNPSVPGKFKMSQFQDPVFFRAHEKEMREALSSGQVEEDRY